MVQVHIGGEQNMRPLNKRERAVVRRLEDKTTNKVVLRAYGCNHCNVHVGPKESSPWMMKSELQKHLKLQ